MDPAKIAQMVSVLNGLTAHDALCLLVGCMLNRDVQRTGTMKHETRRFEDLAVVLKEIEPFIRSRWHLESGREFKNFGDMRSREILAIFVNSVNRPSM
jgi:hypothetical protein